MWCSNCYKCQICNKQPAVIWNIFKKLIWFAAPHRFCASLAYNAYLSSYRHPIMLRLILVKGIFLLAKNDHRNLNKNADEPVETCRLTLFTNNSCTTLLNKKSKTSVLWRAIMMYLRTKIPNPLQSKTHRT